MNRTHNNGELRFKMLDKSVELKDGFLKKRNLGTLVFIDLKTVMELHKLLSMKKWKTF